MKTIDNFIAEQGIACTVTPTDHNPNMRDDEQWEREASHYNCALHHATRDGSDKPWFIVPFSMGSAHTQPPTAADVLDCLASDAASIENADGFEDWAADYGYDTDSRRAETIYKTCQEQADDLKNFLGEDAYESLLWDTERA